MNDYGIHGFGMGFGWLIPVLLVLAIVYFINNKKNENESAMDMLDKKYASGELNEEEYQTKKDNLKK